MTPNPRTLAPFLAICLVGFGTLFSSYLRLPVLPLYAASLGAGPAEVGMINGAFMLSAGLLSIPAGLLADRSTVLGLALKQIGYPLGFALAGGMALAALAGFWRLMRGAIIPYG